MDYDYEEDFPRCRIDYQEIQFTPQAGTAVGGAFGEIQFAKLRGVDVAVKKIKKQMTEREIEKVRLEVDMLAQLRHPHVGLFMGTCYDPESKILIISERLKEDMEVVLKRIRRSLYERCPELVGHVVIPTEPTLSTRVSWLKDAAKGLNWLHRNSSPVIHRDIKPANFLFDNFGCVKVCDFGLSRFQEEICEEQNPVGTPIYMAPEILDRETRIFSEKTDVYAFGILMWEVVTCLDALVQQGYKTMPQLKLGVQQKRERPPIPNDTPLSLRGLIDVCWAPDPEDRPTFDDILNCIDHVIDECRRAECRQKVYEASGGDSVASNFWYDLAGEREEIEWATLEAGFQTVYGLDRVPNGPTILFALKEVLAEDRPGNRLIVTLKRWGELIGWFGPLESTYQPNGFANRVLDLLSQPYFHGHLSARQAAEKLHTSPRGTFLVRFSGSSFASFVVSTFDPPKVLHYTVVRLNNGTYSLAGSNDVYPSISDLLANENQRLLALQPLANNRTFGDHNNCYASPVQEVRND